VLPSSYHRISYYADWISLSTCQISDDKNLSFCPDLVCPLEEPVLGFPQAKIPNATRRVKVFNGFRPVNVTQSPPPGAPFNDTTEVVVDAVDASGRTASCTWTVTYPPTVALGYATLDALQGEAGPEPVRFVTTQSTLSGLIVEMTGMLGTAAYIAKDERVVATILGSRSNATLVLSEDEPTSTLRLQHPIPVAFSVDYSSGEWKSNVTVQVTAESDAENRTILSVFQIFGQVEKSLLPFVQSADRPW
jgi:hypothetical protein